MYHPGGLLMMLLLLLLALANPAPVAGPAARFTADAATAAPPRGSAAEDSTNPQAASRPMSRERLRRAAGIDLKMPYYRFGRLPNRIKD